MRTSAPKYRRSRFGSIYYCVVGVALLVSVIGATAMHVARLELEKVNNQREKEYARSLAQSSVEFALGRINSDPNWRSSYTHNLETSLTPAGISETLSFRLLDNGDFDLDDDANEPVEIKGIGRYGDATFVYSVDFLPSISPDDQFGPLLHAKFDTGGGAAAATNLSQASWLGQYFVPSLPGEAVSWSVTSVDVLLKQNGPASAWLDVGVYTSSSGMPASLIEKSGVANSQLPSGYFDWVSVPFTSVSGLSPGQGLCLCLETLEPLEAMSVQYEGSGVVQPTSHMIEGGSGAWTNTYADKSIYFRVRGFYTTAAGITEFQISPGSWRRSPAP